MSFVNSIYNKAAGYMGYQDAKNDAKANSLDQQINIERKKLILENLKSAKETGSLSMAPRGTIPQISSGNGEMDQLASAALNDSASGTLAGAQVVDASVKQMADVIGLSNHQNFVMAEFSIIKDTAQANAKVLKNLGKDLKDMAPT
jgi:hypothetical protein